MDIKLDVGRAKLYLDDLVLERIIDAVGKPLKHDRDTFRNDLLLCYGRYSIATAGQSGFVKRQRDRLNSIQKHARKLVELLKADDADLGTIREVWPIDPALLQLAFLVEIIDPTGKPGDIAERTRMRLGFSGSPLRWLINILLRDVYERHFGAKAGTSRNPSGGTPYGPYIRFTRQVLAEIKVECSDETIASYLEKPEKNS
jgi:hypothetical protein